MEGWIKLYRKLLDDVVWVKSTNEQRVILVALLLMASHKAKEWEWNGEKFMIQPGQFITSIESIIKACNYTVTIQNVRSTIKRFEKLNFLTNNPTKTGRLITIVNWESYQNDDVEGNIVPNKEVTKSQQRGNRQVTPIKNVKNDKNVKNKNIYGEFGNVKLTDEEYTSLLTKFGEVDTKVKIENISSYIASKGDKYKSHYATILNWDRKSNKDNNQKPQVTVKPNKFTDMMNHGFNYEDIEKLEEEYIDRKLKGGHSEKLR